jgi:uncharacterized protein
VWAALPAAGQELVPVPELRARVTDLTGTLDPSEEASLEARLQDLETETGTQIAVLLVPTVRPEAIEQYALRVAESWRLGREGVDDGALLLVALEDRQVRIEVGYGLEGALADATANRIIDEEILPRFRAGDFYGGLVAGVDRMVAVARGEELPPPEAPAPMSENPGAFLPTALFIAFIAGSFLSALLGRVPGALATGGLTGFVTFAMSSLPVAAGVAAVVAFVLTLMMSGARGWSSPRRGGAIGGGFGGGGFGGGFGGGGASGGW